MRIILVILTLVLSTIVANAQMRFADAHPVAWDGTSPSAYPIHGVDVSRYQGAIDWQQLRASGIEFAFIKATEGGDRVDETFAANWQNAARAGVHRGAYHFYYFCTSARAQANWFIRNVPRQAGSLPPVLDMEWNHLSPSCKHRPDGATVRANMLAWMAIVEAHYGQRPIIYTTPKFYRDNALYLIGQEEFWLRSTSNVLSTSYPRQGWSFWQYTATGRLAGVRGNIDINAFGAGRERWQRWLAERVVR